MSRLDERERELVSREPVHRVWVGAVLVGGLLAGLLLAVLTLPPDTASLPAIARRAMVDALPAFRTTEPVSAVVYGFRATDTFGETFLLLAAVVSVVLLSRTSEPRSGFVGEERAGAEEQGETDPKQGETHEEREARAGERVEAGEGDSPATPDEEPVGTPAPERALAMTVVTRLAVRLALPLLAVAGLYLVAQGYSPGGGFPAGAAVLGVVLLVHAAFGYPAVRPLVRPGRTELIEMGGAFAIVVAMTLGLPLAGAFAASWVPLAPEQSLRSGGLLQVFSLAELVEVASGLTLTVFALMGLRHDWASDPEDES